MKKLISIVLALALVLSLSTVAFAADGENESRIAGEVIASDTVALKTATDDECKIVEWTATADGVLSVNMSSTGAGWSLLVSVNGEPITWLITGKNAETMTYDVQAGQVIELQMGAYDAIGWMQADGEITYEVTFSSGDIAIQKEEYVISSTILGLGDNDLTMEENAENTLFEFVPDETGVYKITAPEGTLIGDWSTSFNPRDLTENKTNTLEWTCTGVGQSLLVGVCGNESIVLNVEKVDEYVPASDKEWIIYENTADLSKYTLSEDADLVQVDVTDDVPEIAVLGEDGFYHLNTVDGPILLVDLNEYIYTATGYGNVGHIVYDENGNVSYKVLYNSAIAEYYEFSDFGIYPLTADLMEFYKNYGSAQGWYDSDIPGFYLFGEVEVNPDTAWLFCCYYDASVYPVVPEIPQDPEVNPEEKPEGNPETGDAAVAGLVIAMMASTAGAVIIGKKKEF